MTDAQPTRVVSAVWTAIRPLIKSGYYRLESDMHPFYRATAARRLRKTSISSVLFVCYGNVCRSPYAEYVFNGSLTPLERQAIVVKSAGFIGPDRQSPPEALAAALRRGHDMLQHRSELIETSALRTADLIVVMTAQQERDYRAQFGKENVIVVLGDLDPVPGALRTIDDPWNQSAHVFDACYERIDRCTAELLKLVREGRSHT